MLGFRSPPLWVLWGLAIFINTLWALAYPWSKWVMSDFSPLALAFWRMATGAMVLLPFLKRQDFPKKILLKDIVLLALMGVVGCGLSTWFQFIATVHTLSSHVSILVAIETITVMFFARMILGEAVSFLSWMGALLALSGVALISLDSTSLSQISDDILYGNLMMIASVACYASYTIIGKTLSPRWGASPLTTLPFLFAGVFFLIVLCFDDPASLSRTFNPSRSQWALIFYVGSLCAGFGFLVWNWLLRYMEAAELSKSLYVQPIAGIFFSYLILGEKIDLKMLVGALVVIVGVILSEKKSGSLTTGHMARSKGARQ